MRRRVILAAVAWVVGLVGFRVAVVPPERCGDPEPAAVLAATGRAADWLVDGLGPDGSFVYRYDRDAGARLGGYNLVRHAGAVTALYQTALAGRPELLAPADRALAYLLERRVDHEDWTAIAADDSRAKLGTASLTVAALVHRRLASGDDRHDDLLARLGRFLVAQQEPDGAVLNLWDPRTAAPVPGEYGRFATGEALWALALLDRHHPGGWLQPLSALADHVALARDDVDGQLLREPDHWAAYAFAEMAAPGGPGLDDHHVAYLRPLSGFFSTMIRYESTRTGEGLDELVRGGTALGAGVGTLGEGLAGLWLVSTRDDRMADLSEPLAERLGCTVDVLVDRQVRRDDEPLADGAWFTDDVTQVDDQQHALSALVLSWPVVTATAATAADGVVP